MNEWQFKIVMIRSYERTGLAVLLIFALGASLFGLLRELNDAQPNAALTALLGGITTAFGGALGILIQSIAGTTMENKEKE